MTLISFYTALLHALIGFGIVVFAVADERPEIAVLALPVVVAAYALRRRDHGFGLSARLLNTCLVALTLLALSLASWELEQTVSEIARFIMLIQLLRLFETPSARKWAQEIGLSAMLVLAAALTNVALSVGLLIFLYAALLLVTVLAHQVSVGDWRHGVSGEARSRSVTRAMRRDFLRVAAAASVIVVLCTAAVFLLMPRGVGEDMFLRVNSAGDRGRSVTDFSDSVTLGEQGRINESASPVMRITVSGYTGTPPYHLRGAVLDAYDAERHRWYRSDALRERSEPRVSAALDDGLWDSPEPGEAVARVELLRREGSHLFSLARARRLALPDRADYEINTEDGIIRIGSQDFPASGRYAVLSVRTGAIEAVGTPLEPELGEPFEKTAVPAIARGILAESGVPIDATDPAFRSKAADAFVAYLQEGFGYTLEQVAPPAGDDPLTFFLTDVRRGHCEYFASALAAMCRSVGINARVVTGFLVYDDADMSTVNNEQLTVRRSNAHAWTEIELAPDQWREFDPSPPTDVATQHVPPQGLIGAYQRFMDSIQIAWSKFVVNYDGERQREAIAAATGSDFDGVRSLDRQMQRLANVSGERLFALATRSLASGLIVFLGVLGVLGAFRLAFRRFRSQRRARPIRRATDDGGRAVERVYHSMLRALDRAGLSKPEWCPPAEYIDTLDELDSSAVRSARDIVSLYYRAVFGGQRLTQADVERAHDALAQFRAHLDRRRGAARNGAIGT